ncbi:hypothetical protein EOM33_04205 [Candidatus Saccharibacteria bacterium]|jgi:hypothetical protein|nr:hypothetical protein [Candidatus Saccharibacteria bacterium]
MTAETMVIIKEMKIVLREHDIPFFTDEELEYYLNSEGNFRAAVYKCLILKSEDTSLKTNELTLGDSSKYFRRLASQYRPSNSGVLT